MGFEIIRTDNKNADFNYLIKLLDESLNEINGESQKQFDKHNKVDHISEAVVIYNDKVPAACGAYKEFDVESAELKRIFVVKEARRKGLAKLVVRELEELARSKGYKFAILETGVKQKEAITLYRSMGYEAIQNFEPYIGSVDSVCMRKPL